MIQVLYVSLRRTLISVPRLPLLPAGRIYLCDRTLRSRRLFPGRQDVPMAVPAMTVVRKAGLLLPFGYHGC